jgi:hypothetical protein
MLGDTLILIVKYGFVLVLLGEAIWIGRALAPLLRRPPTPAPPSAAPTDGD